MELTGPNRQSGGEVRWKTCPSCAYHNWAVSQNMDTGAWICYACGYAGVEDQGVTPTSLAKKLKPTLSEATYWPEVPLPEWMPLTRTGRKYLRDRGIMRPEDFGIVETVGGGRIVIPYFGPDGSIIYWVTRSFVPDGQPRYVGAPGRKPLYVLPDWEVSHETTIVEGPFDCIVHHLATGVATIALCGRTIPAYNLCDIRRLAKGRRTLMLDHDALKATLSLAQQLEAEVVRLPAGEDPASHFLEEAKANDLV